jgi:hypothetical protein
MHEDTKLSQGPFPENTTNLLQTHKQNVKQNNKFSGTPPERTTHKYLLLSIEKCFIDQLMHYVLYTHYLQMVYVVFSYMFRSQLGDHLQGVGENNIYHLKIVCI